MRSAPLSVGGAVSALLALPLAAAAQDPGVRLGFLGGISSGKLSSDFVGEDEGIEQRRINAFTGGLSLEFRLTDRVFVDARGVWLRKGFRAVLPSVPGLELRAHIDYVAVPLLLKLRGGGDPRLYVAAGPEVAFKTRARTITRLGGTSEEEDVGDEVESTDFALHAVAGLEFSVGRVSAFVEGGYSHGLRNIAKDEPGAPDSSKTRTFLAQGGLRF